MGNHGEKKYKHMLGENMEGMYRNRKNCIRTNKIDSADFQVMNGVRDKGEF